MVRAVIVDAGNTPIRLDHAALASHPRVGRWTLAAVAALTAGALALRVGTLAPGGRVWFVRRDLWWLQVPVEPWLVARLDPGPIRKFGSIPVQACSLRPPAPR